MDKTKNKDQVISSNAYNAKVRSKLNVYIGGTNKSIAGVYIWTNLKTGEQNVGSSINLYTRLRSYFKPSIVNEGNRLINQSMKKFGIENFKLDLYIINTTGMVNSKIRALTLCLEQYYIFFLNPSLNSVKVAGSNPIVEHTKEHIASIKKANSKPIYVYKDNTLIYQADSANILKKEINISQSTITKCIKNPSFKCFKFLTISHVGPNSDVIIKKWSAEILNNFILENSQTVYQPGMNKKKHIIMTSVNGEVFSFSSIKDAKLHFKVRQSTISSNINKDEPVLIKGNYWFIKSE